MQNRRIAVKRGSDSHSKIRNVRLGRRRRKILHEIRYLDAHGKSKKIDNFPDLRVVKIGERPKSSD